MAIVYNAVLYNAAAIADVKPAAVGRGLAIGEDAVFDCGAGISNVDSAAHTAVALIDSETDDLALSCFPAMDVESTISEFAIDDTVIGAVCRLDNNVTACGVDIDIADAGVGSVCD